MKKYFDWNEESGLMTCKLFGKDGEFIGTAICHPEDEDFKSQLTGGFIAEMRADIAYLKHQRDNQLKPAIKELLHVLSILEAKKERSPEVEKVIYRELKNKQEELKNMKQRLKESRIGLSNYLAAKEEYHNKLRAKNNKK